MSTNFYYKVKTGPFAPLMPLHIGLRAGGWVFQFQAINLEAQTHELRDGTSQLVVSLELPRINLLSANDWRAFMAENEGVVLDEYNEEMTTEKFWDMVETLSPKNKELRNAFSTRNQYENGPSIAGELEWRDAQGYPMSLNNFS